MAESMRGVIPFPMPSVVAIRLPESGQIAVACPVCAAHVAVAEAVATPAGIEVSIPADQHTLLNLHRSRQHPDRGDI